MEKAVRDAAKQAASTVLSRLDEQCDENDARTELVELLDERTHAMEIAKAEFCAVIHQRISANQQQRNNCVVFMYRLPSELWTAVFDYVLAQAKPSRRLSLVNMLRGVSKAWHASIEHSPALWSWISIGMPANTIATAVEKSGHHPLTIKGGMSRRKWNEKWSDGFINCIRRERHRWKRACLFFESVQPGGRWGWLPLGRVVDILENPLPLLESLELRGHRCLGQEGPINICGAVPAPNLKHIWIDRIRVTWTSPVFSGLHSLKITNLSSATGAPTVDDVVAMLMASPSLAALALCGLNDFPRQPIPDPPVIDSLTTLHISLPCLTRLELEDLPPSLFYELTSRIRATNCSTVELVGNGLGQDQSPATANAYLGHFITPALCARLASALRLTILFTTSYLTFYDGEEPNSSHFSLRLFDGEDLGVFKWLVDMIKQHFSTIPVALHFQYTHSEAYAIIKDSRAFPYFDELPNVTLISLPEDKTGWDDISDFLGYLSCPSFTDGGIHWPFPNLKTVLVERTRRSEASLLLSVLRARYGKTDQWRERAVIAGGVEIPLPCPLERLHFKTKQPKATLKEAERIVGTGRVVHDEPLPDVGYIGSSWLDEAECEDDTEDEGKEVPVLYAGGNEEEDEDEGGDEDESGLDDGSEAEEPSSDDESLSY